MKDVCLKTLGDPGAIQVGPCYYIEDQNIRLWRGHDVVTLCDLNNALKRGSECPMLWVRSQNVETAEPDPWLFLCDRFDGDLRKAMETLPCDPSACKAVGIEIASETRSANRVFSPFALNRMAPLKDMPARWTLPHVIKAMANRQFSGLRCAGKYSDDYAYDDATNYGRGTIRDHLALIKDLVESPSGWWASNKDSSIHVACHHFVSYDFQFELEPVQKARVPASFADQRKSFGEYLTDRRFTAREDRGPGMFFREFPDGKALCARIWEAPASVASFRYAIDVALENKNGKLVGAITRFPAKSLEDLDQRVSAALEVIDRKVTDFALAGKVVEASEDDDLDAPRMR